MLPKSEWVYFVFLDMFFLKCSDLVGNRANAGGGDRVSQEVGVGGAKLGFGGGKLEVVLLKAFDEGADVDDVDRGVGVVNYDVVEVGCHAVEVLDALVDALDEPAGHGTDTLRHDEPFQESVGGAYGREGYGVLVDGYLVE